MAIMNIYEKISDEEIRDCVDALKLKLVAWFDNNPRRKICKVDWFYGKSFNLRRENYKEKLKKEMSRLILGR